MLDWAMTAFEKQRVFGPARRSAQPASMAARHRTSISSAQGRRCLIPVNNPDRLSARSIYRWPLTAPVEAGRHAGTLKIWNGKRLLREVPV